MAEAEPQEPQRLANIGNALDGIILNITRGGAEEVPSGNGPNVAAATLLPAGKSQTPFTIHYSKQSYYF